MIELAQPPAIIRPAPFVAKAPHVWRPSLKDMIVLGMLPGMTGPVSGFGGAGTAVAYATLDPATNANSGTISGGNLTYTATSALGNTIRSDVTKSSGKWYFEFDPSAGDNGYVAVGVCTDATAIGGYASIGAVPSTVWLYRDDALRVNNGASAAFGANWTPANIIGGAIDIDAGNLWWAVDGTWQGSGDPAAGTNPAYTGVTGTLRAMIVFFGTAGSPAGTVRFDPASFTQTMPSGFSAWTV